VGGPNGSYLAPGGTDPFGIDGLPGLGGWGPTLGCPGNGNVGPNPGWPGPIKLPPPPPGYPPNPKGSNDGCISWSPTPKPPIGDLN